MFTSANIEAVKKSFSSFGASAINQHYIGKSEQDVESFLVDVILKEKDKMKNQRHNFYTKYLEIKNGVSSAKNVIDDINKQLKLDLNHA